MKATDNAISNREFLRALLAAVVALGISALLLVAGYLFTFPLTHPEFLPEKDNVTAYSLKGSDFTPVVFAGGSYEGDSSVITALAEGRPDDQAILIRKLRLNTGDYAFLRYDLDGRQPGLRVMLFWKTAASGDEPFYSELDNPGNGPHYHNLRRSGEWQGEITELAIGFFGDLRGGTVKLQGLRLEPYSAGGLFGAVWDEWTQFKPWDQKSINRYVGVPEGALLYPVPGAALWLTLGACIAWVWHRVGRRAQSLPPFRLVPGLAIAAGIAWLSLHGLWMHKLWLQNQETRYLFHGKSLHERRLVDWDSEYYEFAEHLKDALPDRVDRLALLYYDDDMAEPFPQRLRYHLLPEIKLDFIHRMTRGRVRQASAQYPYLLVLHDPASHAIDTLSVLEKHQYSRTGNESILLHDPRGTLLRLRLPGSESSGEGR